VAATLALLSKAEIGGSTKPVDAPRALRGDRGTEAEDKDGEAICTGGMRMSVKECDLLSALMIAACGNNGLLRRRPGIDIDKAGGEDREPGAAALSGYGEYRM
jgi:hypothetical protein